MRANAVGHGIFARSDPEGNAGLKRSSRGVINVVVLKDDGLTPTVPAEVAVAVTDPLGRTRELDMPPVTENDKTSYMGNFDVENNQTLRFEIQVSPTGAPAMRTIRFDRRFFVE